MKSYQKKNHQDAQDNPKAFGIGVAVLIIWALVMIGGLIPRVPLQ